MKLNTERLTKEFCKGKMLIFYPRSPGEAVLIQMHLFGMGFVWSDNTGAKVQYEDYCINGGMMLDAKGFLWTQPRAEQLKIGLVCTADQFADNYESLRDISARLERLEKKLFESDASNLVIKKKPPTPDLVVKKKPPQP